MMKNQEISHGVLILKFQVAAIFLIWPAHQLDYLDFLFGPVQKVKSIVLNQAGLYKAEDFVTAEFVFPE